MGSGDHISDELDDVQNDSLLLLLEGLESILSGVEFFFSAVGQVLFELDLLVADSDEVSDFEDEGEDEGKEPEDGTDFSVLLGIELQEIDLAQDLEVVKEPVAQKAQSVQDVEVEGEFIFFNLIQKLSDFLIFINTLEQSEQLSSVPHSNEKTIESLGDFFIGVQG